MGRQIFSGPAIEPVTVQDLVEHSRIPSTDDELYCGRLIRAAREHIEGRIERALITQVWDFSVEAFGDAMEIPIAPLQSIESITYIDTSGAAQVLDPSVYSVDFYNTPGVVRLAYGQTWPAVRDTKNAIIIRAVVGYGDDGDDVPLALRHAVLLLAATWYEFRESVIAGTMINAVPVQFEDLLAPFRWEQI